MLKSKIHRATVTQADLHYVGSVTVDEDLMEAADLLPGEQVAIVDVTNGARLETYVITGPRGSGVIGINGAAARLVHPGDLVILIAYGQMDDAEARRVRAAGGLRRPGQPHHRYRPRPGRGAARHRPAPRGRRRAHRLLRRRPGAGLVTAASRLLAPEPGWTTTADVVVVGSGVAGLTAALHCARAGSVLLVTKVLVDDGSTRWAQGGVAAALGPDDSPDEHQRDTLVAGVGLCDEAAVQVLCEEGPARLRELMALGAAFDRDPSGELSLTREGGHHRDRIVHAGGDATGAEVQRALVAAVRADGRIRLVEHALVLDLLRTADGRAAGVTLHVLGEGTEDGVGSVHARAVVLATGGMGQVFSSTTNPSVSTGDGVALALRAGAAVADLEFVQFHPTALYLGASEGQQPLVSEAVRGEGAVLVDAAGHRVITTEDHPLADLAPRDVVAKAIHRRMLERDEECVYLDARHLGEELLLRRFPTIVARCRAAGIDPVVDLVPVAPAAHYASGGVRTDLSGRTDVPGLYACGEVACTGVHGANRLASNSLLEGLVFAARIGADLERSLPPAADPVPPTGEAVLVDPSVRADLGRAMTRGAGVLRSADGLAGASAALAELATRRSDAPGPDAWEATDLLTVAGALVAAASAREETRGAHWREDHPARRGRLARPPRHHAVRHGVRARHAPGARVSLRPQTVAALDGVDPAAVEDLVRRAVAEDLAGGVDVTSTATVPADLVGTGAFVPRRDGVVAGLGAALAVLDVVLGDALQVGHVGRDGQPAVRGEPVLEVTGSGAAAADRGAHRAEPALPPVRRRDADPAVGRRGRRHRRAHPRHPQDDARPARPREGRGACGRRRQPPDVAVGRGAGEGQPRRRRRRRRGGVRRGAHARSPASRSRSSATRRCRSARCSRPGPTWSCSTT